MYFLSDFQERNDLTIQSWTYVARNPIYNILLHVYLIFYCFFNSIVVLICYCENVSTCVCEKTFIIRTQKMQPKESNDEFVVYIWQCIHFYNGRNPFGLHWRFTTDIILLFILKCYCRFSLPLWKKISRVFVSKQSLLEQICYGNTYNYSNLLIQLLYITSILFLYEIQALQNFIICHLIYLKYM